MSDIQSPVVSAGAPQESAVQITHVTYALFALGLVSVGLLAVVGVIIAYVKRDDVNGTYLRSHMDWLTRSFWWTLLWSALVVLFVILTLGLGALLAGIPFAAIWLWGAYRIIKGWLRLAEKRAVS